MQAVFVVGQTCGLCTNSTSGCLMTPGARECWPQACLPEALLPLFGWLVRALPSAQQQAVEVRPLQLALDVANALLSLLT